MENLCNLGEKVVAATVAIAAIITAGEIGVFCVSAVVLILGAMSIVRDV